LSPEP
jgi:hypothetical protein